MTKVSSLTRRIAALTLCASMALALVAVAQSAPPIPAKVGAAAGTVEAGGKKVILAHAYVAGPIGEDDPLFQVVLTDAALPEDAIGKELLHRGGQALLRAGKVNGIALTVDATGFIRNAVPFIGELRGSQMLASAGQLTAFAAKEGRSTGQGVLTSAQTTKQGWSYAASWNAAVRPPAK